MTLKIAVVAPIASASVNAAMNVKPGVRRQLARGVANILNHDLENSGEQAMCRE
jgi:hypothetical protein